MSWTHQPPQLVGRQPELALIGHLIEAGVDGQGSLIVLLGEAGIGKTRLAETTTRLAREAGYRVGWGTCWSEAGAPPLWPWQDLLAAVAGSRGRSLLDDRPGFTPVDPERFARFQAVGDLLGRTSAATPLLLVIEDAHAADPAAVLLARFVARASVARRIVMLVSHREPEHEGPVADALADLASGAAVLRLRGLSTGEIVEFAATRGRAIDTDEARALRHSTNGNPLFVEELLAAEADGQGGALPAGIRRAIGRRLDRLSPATRVVLTAVAVLGPAARPSEVAALAAIDEAALDGCRREAVRAALIEPGHGPLALVHDLARSALLEALGSTELARWHQRAATVLAAAPGEPQPDDLIRRAHHALAAARVTAADAEVAVAACREAAQALMRGFAYESAANLLQAAVDVQQRELGPPNPELLVALARATLASGRLNDARPLFRAALERAEATGDHAHLAEAALGLGGVWVMELRALDEHEQYRALLRRALAAVRDDRPDLAARLRVRLAAEELYAADDPGQGRFDEVVAAVEEVRAHCDARGVAEALSLLHHTMLGPRFAEERLTVADELLATASGCGDGVLTLMGLLWRTVDLFLLGRRDAERSLVQLRQRADALMVGTAGLIVREIEVMQLIRAGRLEEAEGAAGDALRIGNAVGDPDSTAWYGGQLLAIRWLQRRGDELLPLARDLARSPDLPLQNQAYDGAVAVLAAEGGHVEEAASAIERLRQGGLVEMPESSTLLVTLFEVIEAAAALGDVDAAADAYARLAPYAALPMIGSLGIVCLGSAERSLGVAARTTGDLDRAVSHLERAVDANRRLGNRSMMAVSQADLADTLDLRGAPGDTVRAGELRAAAVDLGRAAGLTARADEWAARAAPSEPAVAPAALVRAGEFWEISAGDERATVPDSVGMATLAQLLARPGTDVSVERLTGREEGGGSHPVLDRTATDAYRRRVAELRADIDEADADADLERAARLRLELDALVEELTKMLRPGGRSRSFAGPAERARTAVQKALRRAIDRISPEAPVLADQLRKSVRTGTSCRYDPVEGAPARWQVRTGP